MEPSPFSEERTPRGHDLTLLRELQELSPAERIERNCQMAELVEQLRVAGEDFRRGAAFPTC